MVFEDLHWSDDTSLEFLRFLARQSTESPLIVLATYRSQDVSLPLRQWLAELGRERIVQEFTLTPLAPADVAGMLRAIYALNRPVRTEFLDAIYRFTEGNPFFIEETLKSLVAAGDTHLGESGWNSKSLSELRIPRSGVFQHGWRRRARQRYHN